MFKIEFASKKKKKKKNNDDILMCFWFGHGCANHTSFSNSQGLSADVYNLSPLPLSHQQMKLK